jgi:RNA polymerase sigma-70 factor (ECF subfamily)
MGGIALARPELKVDAFADAVAPHYPALVRRLAVVVGDPDAGLDLAQETYLRAFRAWDRFDGADVRAWLHTVGLSLAFNESSRRRRWSELLRARRREPVGWVAPRDLDLHAALSGLRREHRAALLMTVDDGYTHEQIAGMLDVAPGTDASWISRAKQHLRVALEDTTDG